MYYIYVCIHILYVYLIFSISNRFSNNLLSNHFLDLCILTAFLQSSDKVSSHSYTFTRCPAHFMLIFHQLPVFYSFVSICGLVLVLNCSNGSFRLDFHNVGRCKYGRGRQRGLHTLGTVPLPTGVAGEISISVFHPWSRSV